MTQPKPLPEIGRCGGCKPFARRTEPPCGVRWQVVCRVCGRYGPRLRTKRGAINAWNSLTREKGR